MITREDVDGTVPGRAVLVAFIMETPEENAQRFDYTEEEGVRADPLLFARNMRQNLRMELPEFTTVLIANPRARYLEWRRTMEGYGHNLLTPSHFLDTVPSEDPVLRG